MAGPFDIQRSPKGLLDFLGLKATGDAPHTLQQSIGASVSLDRMYLADRIVNTTQNVTITAAGYFTPTSAIVPPGELWFPTAIRCAATNAAGTTYLWAPAYRTFVGTGSFNSLTNMQSAIASATNDCVYVWDELIPYLPGVTFGVYVQNAVLGANPVCQVCLEFYRITV